MTQSINLLPTLTVGTTAVQVDQRGLAYRQYRSIRMQADPANTGQIFGGDSTVTTSKWGFVLNAGDWTTVTGDAVDGRAVWVVASAAGQILHPSGT
jgi:hypothetical protein